MSTRSTQTNEAARCGAFVPVLAAIEGDVALIEVGASAGLCLFPDRYAYRYDDGERLGGSRLEIAVDTARTLRAPLRLPEVSWRAGLDLDPRDVTDSDDVAWLQACIWPEYDERRRRLDLAAQIAASDPPQIDRGHLRDATRALIDEAPSDATKVVFHSAVLAYVDEPSRRAFCSSMRELVGEREDLVWLSNEGRSVVADLDVSSAPEPPPGSGAHFHLGRNRTELIALADGHGHWLRWALPRS